MNKKIVSVIAIFSILIIIIGIWMIKNYQRKEEQNNDASVNEVTNPDFKLNVTDELDLEKLKSYNLPIIIDFGSSSCMPCREMAPVIRKLNSQLQGKAIIKYVDVWKHDNLAEEYSVELIPMQIFICSDGTPFAPQNAKELGMELVKNENGEHIFTRHVGALTEGQIISILKEMGLSE